MATSLITGKKTPEQVQAMREGGAILARFFSDIKKFVHAGITDKQIDVFAASKIKEYGLLRTASVKYPPSS